MEERVKTSFIPKASLSAERKQEPKGNPIGLVNLITGVVLVLAMLASGGVFLFEKFTIQNIATKRQSLERSRSAFEPATIKELVRLDNRLETGKNLLGSHVSLSKLFDELEATVLASVRFTDFSYDATNGERMFLSSSGEAKSYNAVALQSGDFSKSDIITDPIFSNVNIGPKGEIRFDFTAVINPARIRYTTPVGNETPEVLPPESQTPPPATQSTTP